MTEPTRLIRKPPSWQAMIDSTDPETKLRGFVERGRATAAWAAQRDAERMERHRVESEAAQIAVSIAESELAAINRRHAEEEAAKPPETAVDRVFNWLFAVGRR